MGIAHSSHRKPYLDEVKNKNRENSTSPLPSKSNSDRFPEPPYDCERSFVSCENEIVYEERVTPGGHIMAILDPRSPNGEISRTPIVINDENASSSEKLLKKLLLSKQTEYENKTPTGGKGLFSGFDPRSPTEEIKRTPIAFDGKPLRERFQDSDSPCPPARVSSSLSQPKRLLIPKLHKSEARV